MTRKSIIEGSAESIATGVYRNVICDEKVVVYGVSVNARRATELWALNVMKSWRA
ncbi:MAG: hypothetical protein AAF787_24690 [Chloroflexota bacterium]